MLLDGIQQVEIINQGIDWPNIIAMFLSVFCAAGLAYLTSYALNKKQLICDRMYDYYVELLKNTDAVVELILNKEQLIYKMILEFNTNTEDLLSEISKIKYMTGDVMYSTQTLKSKSERFVVIETVEIRTLVDELIQLCEKCDSDMINSLSVLYKNREDLNNAKIKAIVTLSQINKNDVYTKALNLKEIIEKHMSKYY